MDFEWNMVPSPESSLSPHLLAQSMPYALPNPESSNTTSMLDMPLSQIGKIPDQRSGFEMTQGVLSPLIFLGRNKDLCSQRSKYESYGALRGCDLGVRDCLLVYCGK